MAIHTTGDMDIWVKQSSDNYQKIKTAFQQFGMPVFDMTEKNFLFHPAWDVYSHLGPACYLPLTLLLKSKTWTLKNAFEKSVFLWGEQV